MSQSIKYSIVMPLYNKEPFVQRAIRSILNSQRTDLEIIVVDDGSKDGGANEVLALNSPQVQLIQQPNAGASAARNTGIRAARGELIGFLDADDEWLPGFLTCIDRLVHNFPDAGAYATATWMKKPSGLIRSAANTRAVRGQEGMVNDYFRIGHILYACTAVVRAPILVSLGGFDETLRTGEDQDLWFRIATVSSFAYSRLPLTIYNLGVAGSLSIGSSTAGIIRTLEKVTELAATLSSPIRREGVHEYLRRALVRSILVDASKHDRDHAIELLSVYREHFGTCGRYGVIRCLVSHPRLCWTLLHRDNLKNGLGYWWHTKMCPPNLEPPPADR